MLDCVLEALVRLFVDGLVTGVLRGWCDICKRPFRPLVDAATAWWAARGVRPWLRTALVLAPVIPAYLFVVLSPLLVPLLLALSFLRSGTPPQPRP